MPSWGRGKLGSFHVFGLWVGWLWGANWVRFAYFVAARVGIGFVSYIRQVELGSFRIFGARHAVPVRGIGFVLRIWVVGQALREAQDGETPAAVG